LKTRAVADQAAVPGGLGKQVDAASLVTASVGIDGVAQAFADLTNPERHTKIIVEPWR